MLFLTRGFPSKNPGPNFFCDVRLIKLSTGYQRLFHRLSTDLSTITVYIGVAIRHTPTDWFGLRTKPLTCLVGLFEKDRSQNKQVNPKPPLWLPEISPLRYSLS